MRLLRAFIVGILMALGSASGAFAQVGCQGQPQAGQWCGNNTGSQGLPGWYFLTPGVFQPIGGGTVIGNPTGASAAPTATIAPILGIPGTSQGTLGFAGVTSGTATITAQATAGSPTLTLPNTTGTFADGASSPLVLSPTTGNVTCTTCATSAASLTANQLIVGSGSQGEQSLGVLGTITTVLHGNAAGVPSFGAVALSSDISGFGTGVATALGVASNTSGGIAIYGSVRTATVNDTIVAGDCGNAVREGTGSTGFFTITLPASLVGFPTFCPVVIINGDTGRGKKLSGFPSIAGNMLWQQQAILVDIVSAAWTVIQQPDRWKLTANTTIYFDPINGLDTNDCLAAGSGNACQTIQGAWTTAATQFDLNGFSLTFQSAASQTYTNAGLNTQLSMHGQQAASKIIIDGGGSTFNMTNGNFAFQTDRLLSDPTNVLGVQFLLQNMIFTAVGGSGGGAISSNGSTIDLGVGINFGSVTTDHMRAVGGSGIFALQNYTISGGANTHMNAQSSSYVLADSLTITCTGTPAFVTAFAFAVYGGQAYAISDTYSGCGGVTGTRFSASLGGMVLTGGSLTYLPGNAAGVVANGGMYNGSNAANTITPEVEGSWTPTVIASTSGTYTASTQQGDYEKNGRNVTIRFTVSTTASSSPVGNLQISGLPFAAANRGGQPSGACSLWAQVGMTNSASFTTFAGFIAVNTSVIQITESGSGQTTGLAAVARGPTALTLQGMCSYAAY